MEAQPELPRPQCLMKWGKPGTQCRGEGALWGRYWSWGWLASAPTDLGAVQGADMGHVDAEQQVQRLRQDPAPFLPTPGRVQVQRSLHVGQSLGLNGGRDAVGGAAREWGWPVQPRSQQAHWLEKPGWQGEAHFDHPGSRLPRTCPSSAGPRQTAATLQGGRPARSGPHAGRSPRPLLARERRAEPGPNTAAERAKLVPCSARRPQPKASRRHSWSSQSGRCKARREL